MYVFRFRDGAYLRNYKGLPPCRYEIFYYLREDRTARNPYRRDRYRKAAERLEDCKTLKLRDAKIFKSKKSLVHTNAYSYGGEIIKVKLVHNYKPKKGD